MINTCEKNQPFKIGPAVLGKSGWHLSLMARLSPFLEEIFFQIWVPEKRAYANAFGEKLFNKKMKKKNHFSFQLRLTSFLLPKSRLSLYVRRN